MDKLLVVVDMQNDFVGGCLGTKEAKAIVPVVADKVKTWDGQVMYTLDTHDNDYLNTPEGKALPVKHCIKGTSGHDLVYDILREAFYRLDKPIIIEKNTFGSTNLMDEIEYWRDLAYEGDDDFEIQFVGVCTDICVVTNALLAKTFFPNMKITVDAKACAGTTPEAHKAALATMKSCQINVINED